MMRLVPISYAIAVLLLACGGEGGGRGLRVGSEPHEGGSTGGGGGFDSPGGSTADSGVGLGNEALSVEVQDAERMTIEVITLACAGDCANVRAVVRGGHAPYSITWEDGSTNAERRVCLDESTTLTVSATDTGIDSDEFRYDAHTVSRDVTATVLDCPDPDGGAPDDELCIENPSIEGTPAALVFDAPPWSGCSQENPTATFFPSTPDLFQTGMHPNTDGNTFANLGFDTPLHEYISQALCAPLRAGRTYSFEVDLATAVDSLGTSYPAAQLAIYGSANACAREELLWTSPLLPRAWTTYCVTLTPKHDAAHLTLDPNGDATAGTTFVWVDNIVPVDACP